MILEGKTALVIGVANKNSIAWAITRSLLREGARVVLTYMDERIEPRVRALAETCEPQLTCVRMDATNDEEIKQAMAEVSEEFDGKLDMLVHSVAYAKKEDLEGGIIETSADGFKLSQEVSAYSLISVVRGAMPMLQASDNASVLTLTYLGSEKVIPNYNVMGICKASLEATTRYLAWDLGKQGIRVNALSAGPLRTLAARGISNFSAVLDEVEKRAPLGRNVTVEEVGDAGLFLLSPWASGITGEVLFVDAGYHIMGM